MRLGADIHFIIIQKLQREFGLSFVTAANLIAEQHKLARKRYSLLEVLTGCGMAGFLALTFAGIPSRRGIVCWLPLAMLPLAFMHLYLINRTSRTPILAPAQELQAQGNTRVPSRSD